MSWETNSVATVPYLNVPSIAVERVLKYDTRSSFLSLCCWWWWRWKGNQHKVHQQFYGTRWSGRVHRWQRCPKKIVQTQSLTMNVLRCWPDNEIKRNHRIVISVSHRIDASPNKNGWSRGREWNRLQTYRVLLSSTARNQTQSPSMARIYRHCDKFSWFG
jgi:hypothetical protein